MAKPKKVKVRLNKLLEPRQGLHDPDREANPKVICKANYDDAEGMVISETGFAAARIEADELIKVGTQKPQADPAAELQQMTVAQLQEFAAAQKPPVDVSACTKKADYLAAILEAQAK